MIETFTVKGLSVPKAEALRYLGCGRENSAEGLDELFRQCMELFAEEAAYKACRRKVEISISGNIISFCGNDIESKSLANRLSGCSEALLFAATVGIAADRLCAKQRILSPARALMLDAIGSAAVEEWCETLCRQWENEFTSCGYRLRTRFSPGYGDLALEVQRPLLQAIESSKYTGISLNESLLMSPRKSVSAFIGIETL